MKPKVKYLRTAHKGPMGQDLRNIWTCGVRDADGRYHEHTSRESATKCPLRGGKRNPRGRRLTKLQRQVKAAKAAAKRRVAVALAKYLKQQNPGMKIAGAKVTRLKGGAVKIVPIKTNAAGVKKIRGMKTHTFRSHGKVFMEEMRRDGYRVKWGGKQREYEGGPSVDVVYVGGRR
jgi:hypothetical protein